MKLGRLNDCEHFKIYLLFSLIQEQQQQKKKKMDEDTRHTLR